MIAANHGRGDHAGDAGRDDAREDRASHPRRAALHAPSPKRSPTNPAREQEHEDEQDRAQGRCHGERRLRQRRHRHGQRAFAAIAVHDDAHLPGAGAHQPQVTGEEPSDRRSIARRDRARARTARRRRSAAAARCERPDLVAGRQDFDVGHAGNGQRWPHRHEQPIRSRVRFEKHVGAADVRARCVIGRRSRSTATERLARRNA